MNFLQNIPSPRPQPGKLIEFNKPKENTLHAASCVTRISAGSHFNLHSPKNLRKLIASATKKVTEWAQVSPHHVTSAIVWEQIDFSTAKHVVISLFQFNTKLLIPSTQLLRGGKAFELTLLEHGFKQQQSNQANAFRNKYGDGPSYNVKNGKLVLVNPESSDSSISEEEEVDLSTIPNEPTQDNDETLDKLFREPLLIAMTERDQKGLAKLVAKEVAEIIGVFSAPPILRARPIFREDQDLPDNLSQNLQDNRQNLTRDFVKKGFAEDSEEFEDNCQEFNFVKGGKGPEP